MIILGIDPDSEKHGVAIYKDGKLESLESFSLLEIQEYIEDFIALGDQGYFVPSDFVVHIEDVNAVSAAFRARDNKNNIHVKLKMAQSIGMCKQAQVELERLFNKYGIKTVKHKISKQWKKDKALFEKITGWSGRSNEDTRSAAYFGWLGVRG